MSDFDRYSRLPAEFSGTVRLFPLPNLVMFPGVLQPLHVFEERYVQLLRDALAGDRLIAMALLAPGWERDYEGRPPIAEMVCIGRVLSHAPSDQGRFNLLLQGARRARVTRELPPSRSFRQAEVELLDDIYPAEGTPGRAALQRRLLETFSPLVPGSEAAQQQFHHLLATEAPLGLTTDVVAHALDFPLDVKLDLLAECNVDRRAGMLIELIQTAVEAEKQHGPRPYPPGFSDN